MMNTDELLKILACPKCKGPLAYSDKNKEAGFECGTCQLVYPIRDDIPVMLIDEAIASDVWHAEKDS